LVDETKRKGSRKLFALDIGITVLFLVSIIAAFGNFYSSSPKTVSISQTQANDQGVVTWDIAYNFTSDAVFSALNPITISVIVHLDDAALSKYPNLTQTADTPIYIYFPAATPTKSRYTQFGEEYGEPLVINKGSGAIYKSSTVRIYSQEGPICAFLTTVFLSDVPSCDFSMKAPLLTISSAGALYQYQTDKTNLSLTLVVLAFTIILFRDFVSGVGENIKFLRQRN